MIHADEFVIMVEPLVQDPNPLFRYNQNIKEFIRKSTKTQPNNVSFIATCIENAQMCKKLVSHMTIQQPTNSQQNTTTI
jgi:hypothetical protein